MLEPAQIKILDWNMLAKDKMWNGSGWYGFIEVISTSTTDISLGLNLCFGAPNAGKVQGALKIHN